MAKTTKAAPSKKVVSSSSASSSSDSDSDDQKVVQLPPAKAAVNKVLEKKDESSDSSDSDSSDSDDDVEAIMNKRKLEDSDEPVEKRSKSNDGQAQSAIRTVFVGGLPYTTTQEEVERKFSAQGEIESIRMTFFEDTGRCKGTALITYKNAADAVTAQQKWDKQDFGGRYLVVNLDRYAGEDSGKKREQNDRPRTQHQPPGARPENCDTLFVANLPWAAGEDDLARSFEKFGEVVSVRIPTDPQSGKKKGFGYVQFANGEDTEVAMKGGPISILDRDVRLDFSAPRDRTGGGDRNGGGDRRGGFNRGGDDRRGGFNRGGNDDRRGGFNRGGNDDRRGGFNRGGDDRRGGDRKPYQQR